MMAIGPEILKKTWNLKNLAEYSEELSKKGKTLNFK